MSAAKLKQWSHPSSTFLQFSNKRNPPDNYRRTCPPARGRGFDRDSARNDSSVFILRFYDSRALALASRASPRASEKSFFRVQQNVTIAPRPRLLASTARASLARPHLATPHDAPFSISSMQRLHARQSRSHLHVFVPFPIARHHAMPLLLETLGEVTSDESARTGDAYLQFLLRPVRFGAVNASQFVSRRRHGARPSRRAVSSPFEASVRSVDRGVPLTRVTSAVCIVTDSRTRFTYSSSSIDYVLTHTCVRDIVRIYYTGSDPRVHYCEHL